MKKYDLVIKELRQAQDSIYPDEITEALYHGANALEELQSRYVALERRLEHPRTSGYQPIRGEAPVNPPSTGTAAQDPNSLRPKAAPVCCFNDPVTERFITTCSLCQKRVSQNDNYCKHCGAEFVKRKVLT